MAQQDGAYKEVIHLDSRLTSEGCSLNVSRKVVHRSENPTVAGGRTRKGKKQVNANPVKRGIACTCTELEAEERLRRRQEER